MIINKGLQQLLQEIKDPRRDIFLKIYEDHKELFHQAKGSSYNHQTWDGGYADHIAEVLRINDITYDSLSKLRELPFSKDSAAIALFLHDIEKPFRYGIGTDDRCDKWHKIFNDKSKDWEKVKWDIIADLQARYGFDLTDDEINALKYTHGEGLDHQKGIRVAKPLAAHVHHCDNISARIWYDKGRGLSIANIKK